MFVISNQRGLALPVAALASAALRLCGARQNRTAGLPVVFTLAPASAVAGEPFFMGGLRHG